MIEWKDSVWVTLYTQEGDSNLHHFTRAFFVQNFGAKNHTAKCNYRKAAKKLPKRLTYEKVVRKTLMKLTPVE